MIVDFNNILPKVIRFTIGIFAEDEKWLHNICQRIERYLIEENYTDDDYEWVNDRYSLIEHRKYDVDIMFKKGMTQIRYRIHGAILNDSMHMHRYDRVIVQGSLYQKCSSIINGLCDGNNIYIVMGGDER